MDAVINFTAGMGGDVGFKEAESDITYDESMTDLVFFFWLIW